MSTKGIPKKPGGKANQTIKRTKKPTPFLGLHKDIDEGVRYFWNRRPHLTKPNSHYDK